MSTMYEEYEFAPGVKEMLDVFYLAHKLLRVWKELTPVGKDFKPSGKPMRDRKDLLAQLATGKLYGLMGPDTAYWGETDEVPDFIYSPFAADEDYGRGKWRVPNAPAYWKPLDEPDLREVLEMNGMAYPKERPKPSLPSPTKASWNRTFSPDFREHMSRGMRDDALHPCPYCNGRRASGGKQHRCPYCDSLL